MTAKYTYMWFKHSFSWIVIAMLGSSGCMNSGEHPKDSNSSSSKPSKKAQERSIAHATRAIDALEASTDFVQEMNQVDSFGQAIEALSSIGVGMDSSMQEMIRGFGQQLELQSRSFADISPIRRMAGRVIRDFRSTRTIIGADDPSPYALTANEVDRGEVYFDVKNMLEELLRDKVFHVDNIESASGQEATFLLDGEKICTYEEAPWDCEESDAQCPGMSEDPTEEKTGDKTIDEECADMIDALQIRVITTFVEEDGLDIRIKIGEERIEPLALELRKDSYIVQVDIQAMVRTEVLAAELVDETIDLPDQAKGKLQAKIEVLGDDAIATSYSIVEAIDLEFRTNEGPWRLQAATSDPMYLLALDAQLESILSAINLGALDLSFPESTISTQMSGSQIDMHIAGFSGTTQVSSQDQTFEIRNLSLGHATSWMKRSGVPVASIDLNQELGGSLSLLVETDSSGLSANITFSPAFHLVADFLLEDLALETGWSEQWIDDRYEIVFEGETPPTIYPYFVDETGDAVIAVRSGRLIIRIDDGREILVESGQCLLPDPVVESTEHPLLGSLSAGSCP